MDWDPYADHPPRLIIHGGAGNILPSNLPPSKLAAYKSSLARILTASHQFLLDNNSALDTATYAVTQLENDPLFNSGKGAVFTRDGVNELEASVMVSMGKKKRGVGVAGVRRVKNPILLAKEMLLRGEKDLEGGNGEHRGPMMEAEKKENVKSAQGHELLFGPMCEELAESWGVETVKDQSYFFTQNRWDEHVAGLAREKQGKSATWDAEAFVSQGTCGAVVLDAKGVLCVATSTGGMTNKLTGRIGDTPTLGAGFWAESWVYGVVPELSAGITSTTTGFLGSMFGDCLPSVLPRELELKDPIRCSNLAQLTKMAGRYDGGYTVLRSVAVSGTGNGDSFLRTCAAHSACHLAKITHLPLLDSVAAISGPGGELQESANDRWKKTGEGEGGMIGVEYAVLRAPSGRVVAVFDKVVADYNCGGMFRGWVDERGKERVQVWRDGEEEEVDEGMDEKSVLVDV